MRIQSLLLATTIAWANSLQDVADCSAVVKLVEAQHEIDQAVAYCSSMLTTREEAGNIDTTTGRTKRKKPARKKPITKTVTATPTTVISYTTVQGTSTVTVVSTSTVQSTVTTTATSRFTCASPSAAAARRSDIPDRSAKPAAFAEYATPDEIRSACDCLNRIAARDVERITKTETVTPTVSVTKTTSTPYTSYTTTTTSVGPTTSTSYQPVYNTRYPFHIQSPSVGYLQVEQYEENGSASTVAFFGPASGATDFVAGPVSPYGDQPISVAGGAFSGLNASGGLSGLVEFTSSSGDSVTCFIQHYSIGGACFMQCDPMYGIGAFRNWACPTSSDYGDAWALFMSGAPTCPGGTEFYTYAITI